VYASLRGSERVKGLGPPRSVRVPATRPPCAGETEARQARERRRRWSGPAYYETRVKKKKLLFPVSLPLARTRRVTRACDRVTHARTCVQIRYRLFRCPTVPAQVAFGFEVCNYGRSAAKPRRICGCRTSTRARCSQFLFFF
jgi:hypothetical protein